MSMPDFEWRSSPPNDLSLINISDLTAALGTELDRGLGTEEAVKPLRTDGPNEFRAMPPVPAWHRVLAQSQDPLVYLLGVAAAVALAAWWYEGSASRVRPAGFWMPS